MKSLYRWRGGDMTEEAFLRYRMAVVERMPDSPSKRALIIAIQSRMKALRVLVPVERHCKTVRPLGAGILPSLVERTGRAVRPLRRCFRSGTSKKPPVSPASGSPLMRWQKLPEFQKALRKARREALSQTIVQARTSRGSTTILFEPIRRKPKAP